MLSALLRGGGRLAAARRAVAAAAGRAAHRDAHRRVRGGRGAHVRRAGGRHHVLQSLNVRAAPPPIRGGQIVQPLRNHRKGARILKIDTEGFESLVIAGGIEFLREESPVLIFMEFHFRLWKTRAGFPGYHCN